MDDLLAARGAGKTICPSEVARALTADWRPLMPMVHAVVRQRARAGEIELRQRGQLITPDEVGGVYRIARRGDR